MQNLVILVFCVSFLQFLVFSWSQNQQQQKESVPNSSFGTPHYHGGRVLNNKINLYIIWYGQKWNNNTNQSIIRDFILSLSSPSKKTNQHPSVSDWWHTVTLYTDNTSSNISNTINLSGEFYDLNYSQGMNLKRLAMESVINNAMKFSNSTSSSSLRDDRVYLILTSHDVAVQDFCQVCGFHYFTSRNVPYAWVGDSRTQCLKGTCDYPFERTQFLPPGTFGPPNGDPSTDGMISVIAHELAEMSSNPLIDAWYGGEQTAPNEIADMCMGVYGQGGGGGYIGAVYSDSNGNGYNMNGFESRRFLVQWVWNNIKHKCDGPNQP